MSTYGAELLRRQYPKAHFATIYAKPQGRPQVDTFITDRCELAGIRKICAEAEVELVETLV